MTTYQLFDERLGRISLVYQGWVPVVPYGKLYVHVPPADRVSMVKMPSQTPEPPVLDTLQILLAC